VKVTVDTGVHFAGSNVLLSIEVSEDSRAVEQINCRVKLFNDWVQRMVPDEVIPPPGVKPSPL
jgi:hypothetical protein